MMCVSSFLGVPEAFAQAHRQPLCPIPIPRNCTSVEAEKVRGMRLGLELVKGGMRFGPGRGYGVSLGTGEVPSGKAVANEMVAGWQPENQVGKAGRGLLGNRSADFSFPSFILVRGDE